MVTLYLILLALILSLLGLSVRRIYLKNKTRDRLNYGHETNVAVTDVNLAAGDYGLTGNARFFYYLGQFLDSPQGNLLIFSTGAIVAVLLALISKSMFSSLVMTAIFGGAVAFLISKMLLRANRNKRIRLIKDELPNALQMTAAIMESGMGFEASISHVIREADVRHPLYFDLSIMSEAMQRGRRRNEALRLWAARTNEPTVSDVAAAMIQADQTGSSLGAVLKHHATTLLRENEAEIMRRAERLPVKMLAPMVLLVLPAVLIVAAGPSVNRIFQIFKIIMSKA